MVLPAPDWSPPRRQLRQFTWAGALVLGALAWQWPGPWEGLALRLAAAVVFAAGTVWPGLFLWPYRVLLAVALPPGWLLSHVLLALVYFGLVTPLALAF